MASTTASIPNASLRPCDSVSADRQSVLRRALAILDARAKGGVDPNPLRSHVVENLSLVYKIKGPEPAVTGSVQPPLVVKERAMARRHSNEAQAQSQNLNASGVYQWRNLVNGKVYVGSSHDLRSRRKGHVSALQNRAHGNKHLQRAWNKYGEESFEFSVIEYCLPEDLLKREQHWIDALDATNQSVGYNVSPTAGSPRGLKHSPSCRRKISQRTREAFRNPETRARVSAGLKAHWEGNDEARKKHSQKLMEVKNTPEALAKASRGSKRSWKNTEIRDKRIAGLRAAASRRSPEEKARIAAAISAAKSTPEARARISAACKKANNRPKTRAKIAAIGKAIWSDPEQRARRVALNQRPEVCEKTATRLKELWADPTYRTAMLAARKKAKMRRERLLRKETTSE